MGFRVEGFLEFRVGVSESVRTGSWSGRTHIHLGLQVAGLCLLPSFSLARSLSCRGENVVEEWTGSDTHSVQGVGLCSSIIQYVPSRISSSRCIRS